VHEDLIASGRRHVVVVAALGILMLALALALIFFPFALGVGALSTALGGSWGYGWKLIGLSFASAFLFALAIVLVGFVWQFRHAERELLTPMHAFPRPFSGQTTSLPPPGAPAGEHKRVRELVDGISIAAGVLPPSCAVLRDPAPNCLTIGRKPETAWVIVTTGLVESLSRDELESVLAYEVGRIAVLEVSLDTAVYACTARVFELWAAPFAGFGHDSFLLIPVSILTAPLAVGCVLLRRHVLRSRAKLSDGLAVRYCRNPAALLSALRKIDADPRTVRAASLDDAHLWLQYPHTRLSRTFFGSRKILRQRIRRLEALTPGGE
jgi:Zn-dependent protease with chaperone function